MKYKLTKETKIIGEIKLYRIKALKDFGDVKKGHLGGFVEKEKNLSQKGDAWVYDDACVFGNTFVFENACVLGNSYVFGNSWKKSPLQIQGSRHYVNMLTKNILKIGCLEKEVSWWIDNYKEVGKKKGYTKEEVQEYYSYIDLAKNLQGV